MATYTYASSPSPLQDTDANFRLWVTGVVTVLNNLLTDCADTGEINLSTVAKPAAANTYQGYKMYRFSDTLQSTYPIYLKIGFGSYNTATVPSMTLQYGTGTDGALGLTGIVSPIMTLPCYIGATVTGRMQGSSSMAATTGGGRFWVSLWDNASANAGYYACNFGFERMRDASGVPIGGGYAFQTCNPTSTANLNGGTVYFAQGAWTAFNGNGHGGMTPYAANGTRGSNYGVWPAFAWDGSLWRGPLYSMLLVKTATITPGGTISVTHYGSARTLYCLANPSVYAAGKITVGGVSNTAAAFESQAMVWE